MTAANGETVTVNLGDRSYPIVIDQGLLAEVGGRMRARLRPGRAAVVTNPTVGALYLPPVVASLRAAGYDPVPIEVPDGEEYKTLASVGAVYDRLIAARCERGSPVVALGGGVIGDLAGFVAATFLRGVPFVQVPTTLLAQVDSSVGGKTGVNHAAGKNLIGAFYQPSLVVIDLDTLRTLPRREYVAGLAEVIKYGAILDGDLFAMLEARIDEVLALEPVLLRRIVARCCALKARVVEEDEREADRRAILNFGHTVGHAVESLTDYRRFLHGEAVAIGMAFAVHVSLARGLCGPETRERTVALLRRAGLPVDLPREIGGDALAQCVAGDKKVTDGRVKFVCLSGVGHTRFEFVAATDVARHAAELQ